MIYFDLTTWYIVAILVICSNIWMAYDAQEHKISIDDKPYGTNNGAIAWFLSGVLLWIATFPYYLVKRSKALQTPTTSQPTAGTGGKLAELNDLYQKKLITEEEYTAKRKQILEQM